MKIYKPPLGASKNFREREPTQDNFLDSIKKHHILFKRLLDILKKIRGK